MQGAAGLHHAKEGSNSYFTYIKPKAFPFGSCYYFFLCTRFAGSICKCSRFVVMPNMVVIEALDSSWNWWLLWWASPLYKYRPGLLKIQLFSGHESRLNDCHREFGCVAVVRLLCFRLEVSLDCGCAMGAFSLSSLKFRWGDARNILVSFEACPAGIYLIISELRRYPIIFLNTLQPPTGRPLVKAFSWLQCWRWWNFCHSVKMKSYWVITDKWMLF